MLARRFVLGGVLATIVAAGAGPMAAQGIGGNISGVYRAEGRNPNGSSYTGQVTIQENLGGAVAFGWNVGGQTYAGVGVREGRVVTVNWGSNAPVVYVIMPDGTLHGTWDQGRALERLLK